MNFSSREQVISVTDGRSVDLPSVISDNKRVLVPFFTQFGVAALLLLPRCPAVVNTEEDLLVSFAERMF